MASVGQGDINIVQALKHVYPEVESVEPPKSNVFDRFVDRVRGTKGVRIQGVDGLMVRYAQCCQPVPGDPVVGYVTRGRGVSIPVWAQVARADAVVLQAAVHSLHCRLGRSSSSRPRPRPRRT